MNNVEKRKKIVFVLPVVYFLVAWGVPWGDIQWDSTVSISYLFDILFCMIVLSFYRPRLHLHLAQGLFVRILAVFILAALSVSVCLVGGLTTPFRFVEELPLQVLVLAPILEECVFRFALFEPLRRVIRKKIIMFCTNAALFSLSHAYALRVLPDSFHPFIYFQLSYTFLLGWVCAKAKDISGSLVEPILLHFIFNLMFYLAVVFWDL